MRTAAVAPFFIPHPPPTWFPVLQGIPRRRYVRLLCVRLPSKPAAEPGSAEQQLGYHSFVEITLFGIFFLGTLSSYFGVRSNIKEIFPFPRHLRANSTGF